MAPYALRTIEWNGDTWEELGDETLLSDLLDKEGNITDEGETKATELQASLTAGLPE